MLISMDTGDYFEQQTGAMKENINQMGMSQLGCWLIGEFGEIMNPNGRGSYDTKLDQNGEPFVLIDMLAVLIIAILLPSPPPHTPGSRLSDHILDLILVSLIYLAIWRADKLVIEGWKLGHRQIPY